jgi:hypothetical protein
MARTVSIKSLGEKVAEGWIGQAERRLMATGNSLRIAVLANGPRDFEDWACEHADAAGITVERFHRARGIIEFPGSEVWMVKDAERMRGMTFSAVYETESFIAQHRPAERERILAEARTRIR